MIILTLLLFISDLIELTYDLGMYTRKHILPLAVRLYVAAEFTYSRVIDSLTCQQLTLKVRNTPLTTGFCHGTRRMAIA